MKKVFSLILSVVLLISICVVANAETYSIADATIIDNESCTFILKEVKETFNSVQISVFCENKTDKLLMFSLGNVVVNGYMNDPFWATELSAGKKANQTIEFYTDGVSGESIDQIDELRFDLLVYDSEDWEAPHLVEDSFAVYPTGLSADTFVRPERVPYDNETLIADDENGTFIICAADPDSAYGYTLTVFIENKTDETMMVSWDDVSVNDYMADPFWGYSVAPNACAVTEISFWTALEDNGIEEVDNIEFRLRMSDYDSMGDIEYLNDVFIYSPTDTSTVTTAKTEEPKVSVSITPTEDSEPTFNTDIGKDISAYHVYFNKNVNNDVTGNWRVAQFSESIDFTEYALSYYQKYFESDSEVHFVINRTYGTTTRLTVASGLLFLTTYEYVDGEEHDAKKLPAGMQLGKCIIDISTGKIEDVSDSE